MEVSPHADRGRGRDLGTCADRVSEPHLLFVSRSYSALRAPAIPGAARGEPRGAEGAAPALSPLLTPTFSPEPEGDAAEHPAEGPLHPHRRRWGSPWYPSPQPSGGGGWRRLSGGKRWAVRRRDSHRRAHVTEMVSSPPSFLSLGQRPGLLFMGGKGVCVLENPFPAPRVCFGSCSLWSALVAEAIPAWP